MSTKGCQLNLHVRPKFTNSFSSRNIFLELRKSSRPLLRDPVFWTPKKVLKKAFLNVVENSQRGIRRAHRFGAAGRRAPWFYLQFKSRVGVVMDLNYRVRSRYFSLLQSLHLRLRNNSYAKIIVQKQTKKKVRGGQKRALNTELGNKRPWSAVTCQDWRLPNYTHAQGALVSEDSVSWMLILCNLTRLVCFCFKISCEKHVDDIFQYNWKQTSWCSSSYWKFAWLHPWRTGEGMYKTIQVVKWGLDTCHVCPWITPYWSWTFYRLEYQCVNPSDRTLVCFKP